MTVKFNLVDFYRILKDMPKDIEGFANKYDFIEEISAKYICSRLAVRSFLNRSYEHFEQRHGLIRERVSNDLPDQEVDQKAYEAWLSTREAVLNECVSFLQTVTPSPIVEAHLVTSATSREQLRSYSDERLQILLLNLKRDYGFAPQTILTEGSNGN